MSTLEYCAVTLKVMAENRQEFCRLMGEVMPVFSKYDWRLIHHVGLDKSASSVGGSRSDHPDVFYHLWQIPSFDSLISVMNLAADTGAYVELDKLVVSEVQNAAVSAYYDPAAAAGADEHSDEHKQQRFMLEELDMVRDPALCNEFAVQMNTTVVAMHSKFQWKLLHAFIGSTGQTNRWVHLWGVPADCDHDEAVRYYRMSETPWSEAYRKTVKTWRQSWWEPVSYGADE